MSARYLDTMTERHERAAYVADVRAFDGNVKIGRAKLEIKSGWKQHDDRWMEWRFSQPGYQSVEVEGFYHSAHGIHAEGWRAFLKANMSEAQYESYQDGDDEAWKSVGLTRAV